jgi:hypothetical protein
MAEAHGPADHAVSGRALSGRVVFSRSLYAPEAVQAAAEAYAPLAKIEVGVLDSDIELAYADVDPDVADVFEDELCNFALAQTVRQVRG